MVGLSFGWLIQCHMLFVDTFIVLVKEIAVEVNFVDSKKGVISSDGSQVLNRAFEIHVRRKLNLWHESVIIDFIPNESN